MKRIIGSELFVRYLNGFGITLQENAASIFQATQKYGANFAICGTQAAVVFKSLNGFQAANNATVAGPHYIGTVDGIKVFVDPAYDPNAYVLGFKGQTNLESGAFYCQQAAWVGNNLWKLRELLERLTFLGQGVRKSATKLLKN